MPKLAVITPVRADTSDKILWLDECVQSVLEQTFVNWEMVIVDDHSPIKIVNKWKDSRIKIAKAQPSSPSLCRNTAVGLSSADCILPLDADDKLHSIYVLEKMYEEWDKDHDLIIFGNMVILDRVGQSDLFTPGKHISFPEYKFENVLNLKGVIPVTAMHSRECHIKAGGWKKEFDYGLEDVEYWIAAGKAGFCGLKIDYDVFFYRKHAGSRTGNMRANEQETVMRNKITSIHKDVFEGRYPMACCGGGSTRTSGRNVVESRGVSPMATDLSAFSDNQKVLIRYNGRRQGNWGVVGRATGISYNISGVSFEFPVHADDAKFFKSLGRGKDFTVVGPITTDVSAPVSEPEYQPAAPEVTTIERMPVTESREMHFDLSVLSLNKSITDVLTNESWTVESLSDCDPSELMPYRGVGAQTAKAIIEAAQEFLEK